MLALPKLYIFLQVKKSYNFTITHEENKSEVISRYLFGIVKQICYNQGISYVPVAQLDRAPVSETGFAGGSSPLRHVNFIGAIFC